LRHLIYGPKSVVRGWRSGVAGIYRGPSVLVPLAVAAVMGVAMACGGDPDISVGFGRVINVRAADPVIAERVAFSDEEGRHRVIRSRASNRQLAVVEITIVNRTSIVTPLLIDIDAAQLGDRRGERVSALDPFASAAVVDSGGPDENRFAPLLWGPVDLERNFQARGYMIFDVPKGLTLGSLWWNEVEPIVADYLDISKPP
jgi:hypothetical protein